jgi:hypothetical protein
MKKELILFLMLFWVVIAQTAFAGDYFPLKVGNHWYYNQLDSTGKLIGTDTAEMIRERMIGDIPTIDYTEVDHNDLGSSWANLTMRDSGQFVYASQDKWNFNSPWIYGLHSFYQITEYEANFDTYKVQYVGKVTVPAGTFDSCYQVIDTDVNYGGIDTFAPNVGRIKTHAKNGMSLVLTGYVAKTDYIGIRPIAARRGFRSFAPDNIFRRAGIPGWQRADGRFNFAETGSDRPSNVGKGLNRPF